MSLEDDITENMRLAAQVEEFLKDIRPDQRGSIYTMLLIYTAHTLNVSKQEVLEMLGRFMDSSESTNAWWN